MNTILIMESTITTGHINIGLINSKGNFKLCELVVQNFFVPANLVNYIEINGKICYAQLKKMELGQLTEDTLTFEKPNSNIVIACLKSFNVLYIDDHDLLSQLINIIPDNIHTIIFGENIKVSVKFELSNNIRHIISYTNKIYRNKFNVSECYLVSDDYSGTTNFIKTNLTTNKLVFYYKGNYVDKCVLGIPNGTNKFIFDSIFDKERLRMDYNIPDSLEYLITHSDIKNINRIPRNCVVNGQIPDNVFGKIDLGKHLDLFIAYTSMYPILINRTYYLYGPYCIDSYDRPSPNYRFIKIRFIRYGAEITSDEKYSVLRSYCADQSTISSTQENCNISFDIHRDFRIE